MTYRPNGDYNTDVRLGNIVGREMLLIVGHDETVPNGGPFNLSPEFGVNGYLVDQSAISATPAVVGVASSDNVADNVGGTGALTVLVSGLDGSGNAQSELVTMTGQTAVNTVNTYSAVFTLTVATTGTADRNQGTLWCGTGTFTLGVPAVRMLSMEALFGQSMTAYYVVPTGKIFVMKQMVLTVAAGASKDIEVQFEVSPDGKKWVRRAPVGLAAGDLAAQVLALPALPAGTHLQVCVSGSAANTDVTVLVSAEIVDV